MQTGLLPPSCPPLPRFLAQPPKLQLEFERGVIVVHTEDIFAAAPLGCSDIALIASVRALQEARFKVLTLSRQPELIQRCLSSEPGVAHADVEHLRSHDDHTLDLIRTAEDYSCAFLSNADMQPFANDWRLERRCRTWLSRALLASLQVAFVIEIGSFKMWLPLETEAHLRKLPARAPNPMKEGELEVPGGRQSESRGCAHIFGSRGQTLASPHGEAPPPPAVSLDKATNRLLLQGNEISSLLQVAQVNAWEENPGRFSIASVRLMDGEQLLCIYAGTAKTGWLLPYSNELPRTLVGIWDDMLQYEEDGLSEVKLQLHRGAHWLPECYEPMLATVREGSFQGIRAVGCATCRKVRVRAARIALAATIRARQGLGPQEVGNPSGIAGG